VSGKKTRKQRQGQGHDSLAAEVARLRRENARQAEHVRQLELILAVQKKIAAICSHVKSDDETA
jgi:hypothetical protein